MKSKEEKLVQVLKGFTLQEIKEFNLALNANDSYTSLEAFFDKQSSSEWAQIRGFLYNDGTEIDKSNADVLSSLLAESEELLSQASKKEENVSSLSSVSSSSQDQLPDEPTLRTRSHTIRGDIRTYEIDMMGGFNFAVNRSNLYVKNDIKIRRPIKVTGILGRTAGDHVIPLALFVDNLRSDIAGQPVPEAIAIISEMVSKLGPEYASLVKEAKKYLRLPLREQTLSLEQQLEAFNFLKSTFIPGITAVWNQKVGSAFYGDKTHSDRGTEGARIKSMLHESSGKITDEITELFISNMDYNPVAKVGSTTSSNAYVRLQEGRRTNHYTTLTYVLGEVVEYYITQYNQDPSKNIEIAGTIIDKFFKQHPEWVSHFRDHPKDLGIKSTLIKKNLDSKILAGLIVDDIKEAKPVLVEEAKRHVNVGEKRKIRRSEKNSSANKGKKIKTQDPVEELENYLRQRTGNQGVTVTDAGGEGNCFFLSIAAALGNSTHMELRNLAVEEIARRSEIDPIYSAHLMQQIRANKSSGIETIDDYLKDMAKNGKWVDEFAVRALSEALKVEIHITNDLHYRTIMAPSEFSSLAPIHIGHFGERHYVSILGMPPETRNANLTRYEKAGLLQEVGIKPKFTDILCNGLSNEEKKILDSLRQEEVKQNDNIKLTNNVIHTPAKITLLPEHDHKRDHAGNINKIIELIKNKQIGQDTVICLERKEYGKNFGMQDMIHLANVIKHNNVYKEEIIPISQKILESSIYQDALLYNVATQNGIEVSGIEGKSLPYTKESPNYNLEREKHMVEKINQISSTGKKIIFPVGASHIDGLKSMFPAAFDVVVSRNEEKTPESINIISSRLKQVMSQLKKTSSYNFIDTACISSPNATPISHKPKLSNLIK